MSNPSLFGAGSGANTSGIFGQSSSSTPPANNLFGGVTTPASTNLFGGAAKQNAPGTSVPLFGSAATAKPLFGSEAAQNTSGASTPLFGGANTTKSVFTTGTSSNNAFGSGGQTSTAFGGNSTTNTPSLFNSDTSGKNTTLPSVTSTFGLATPSKPAAAKSPFSFGAISTTPGGPPPPDTSSTTTVSAPSLFNAPTTQSVVSQAATATQPTSTTPAAAPPGGTQSSLFSLGGQTKPAFSFGPSAPSTASTPSTTVTATSTASAPTLFGTAGPAAATTPNLFAGFAQKKDLPTATGTANATPATTTATDSASATAAPAISTGTTAPAAASSSLFSLPKAQTPTTQVSAVPPSTTTASSSAPVAAANPSSGTAPSLFGASTTPASNNSGPLGSSTAGPPPSAQSRLKNKSMDEIITRWASDLAKYQKEFQSQAERVSSWDRMLVENGNAISKLYSRTFQAERDTAELQRQLSAVEGHQDELAQWLDRYEREIDEMLARQVGQNDSMQGPDQERERTYKTAERVSERLNDMGQNLTGMIDEINSTSASIQKTSKPDDPLSQIVRILNGHLSQLQAIDQGTSTLQSKVAAAQKEGQRLGHRMHRGPGNDAVDDFYRSYSRRA